MLTSFDKTTLQSIALEINETLQPLAEKYGIDIQSAGGDYVETNATLSLKLSVRDASGSIITRERSEFERYAVVYGLSPEDFGRDFQFNGHRFTIVGLKPERPKYPILATKHCDGRMYKLSADVVKLALDREGSRARSAAGVISYSDGLPSLRLLENKSDEG